MIKILGRNGKNAKNDKKSADIMDQLPQMSDATRQALKHPFSLEHRGVIEVKGKGKMSTWFLNSPTLGNHIDA